MESNKPWGMEQKTFVTLMHLSQLAGFIIPGAGFLLPILMWVLNKDQSEEIDRHGKVIVNWMISAFIYAIISFILIILVVGIFALWALSIIGIVFAIIGAIKANDGIVWKYPLSMTFIR